MDCVVCEGKLKNKIYENDKIIITLAEEPSTSGHLQIFPKEHCRIFEELSDDGLQYIFDSANKVSIILFELLKVHGTNIIIQNGTPAGQTIPHFSIHIVPRRSDDGLKLDWNLKQAAPDALDSMQRIITEGLNKKEPQIEIPKPKVNELKVENNKTVLDKPVINGNGSNISEENSENKEDKPIKKKNYFLKSLERIP